MDYPPEFLEIWSIFPKRAGSQPKKKAFQCYCARLKEGSTYEEIKAGTIRYLRFCVNTGKIGTEYVMMAKTFLGPDCHFDNPWELPKKETGEPKNMWERKEKNRTDPNKVNEYMEQARRNLR